MNPTRRTLSKAMALATAMPGVILAQPERWPSKPVTLIVPFSPGGGTDVGARLVAQKLSQKWGQQVLVENKAGAVGQIGADTVAKARPDGYTLLMGNIGTQAINPALYSKLPYDPDKAFASITLVADLPMLMLVPASLPVTNAREFVAMAKARPGKLSYASSGAGGAPHLITEMFKQATGAFVVHVPYRGGGPAMADLMAGHVQLLFASVVESIGHVKSGKLKALAVSSAQRVSALPDVPTVAEQVAPGFDAGSWIGLLAPAGTPREIQDRIAADVRDIVATDEVRSRLVELGGVPHTNTPAQFAQLIDADSKRYRQIVKDRGITVD